MKEKVKQTMGRLRKSVRAAGVGLSTLAASFFMSAPAYAAGVEDSQIVTGTEQLIGDLTTWLMVLAPVVSGLLIIYFCIRRGMADEMDQKKWNNRIVAMTSIWTAKQKARELAGRTKEALANREGQGTLDVAITVLISIVLGALILAGLYLIVDSTVLPTITQRIKDMFDYAG